MAIHLHTTDSLISRLLQQRSTTPASAPAPSDSKSSQTNDLVNISSQAREQQVQNQDSKRNDLESHLLRLYTQHDTGES